MTKGNLQKIYRDNTPQHIAVKGLIPSLARLFKREGLPITEKIIKRACQPYEVEYTASKISFTRVLINGLKIIGRTDRANYLINSFAVLTESEKRLMNPNSWIEKVYAKVGEISAVFVSGNLHLLELKMAEMGELMKVRFV